MLLIQNGRVLDPWTGTDAQLDVLIGNDGVIAKIAEKIDAPADCKIFDAAGLTVSPGFVDGHVHFRDAEGGCTDRRGCGCGRRLRDGNLYGEHRSDLRYARDHPLCHRQGEGLPGSGFAGRRGHEGPEGRGNDRF